MGIRTNTGRASCMASTKDYRPGHEVDEKIAGMVLTSLPLPFPLPSLAPPFLFVLAATQFLMN